jgi:hypothetical protein
VALKISPHRRVLRSAATAILGLLLLLAGCAAPNTGDNSANEKSGGFYGGVTSGGGLP